MIYLFIALLSALLTYLVRRIALQKAILDIPNHRSSHQMPMPRGGGLAIVISFYVGLIWYYFTHEMNSGLFYALLSALPIALTGLLDDLLNLSASKRFVVQVLAALIALYFLDLNWYLSFFGFLLIVWFTNLFNFLDGIDGYVSVETLFIAFAAFFFFHDPVFLIFAASVAGFLPYNWQKASIFMGDVGSTFIGFLTGVFFLYYAKEFEEVMIWILLTSVFWFDATFTLCRRLFNGEKITQAHRKHLFQRAVRSGFSHQLVTLMLLGLNFLIFLAVFFLQENLWLVSFIMGIIYMLIAYKIEQRISFDV